MEIKYTSISKNDISLASECVYASSPELLNFIFRDKSGAVRALKQLIAKDRGFFSHKFLTAMYVDEKLAGIELGYDKDELSGQELIGSINMFQVSRLQDWPHLLTDVRRATQNYVPPPSNNAYYMNNFAICSDLRGGKLGEKLIKHVISEATKKGYRFIEGDVTECNERAMRFYKRNGFHVVSTSGSQLHEQRYKLPHLLRIRLRLNTEFDSNKSHNKRIIDDISKMNPVQVDEIYIPGTIEQLQKKLSNHKGTISIGGGRNSMGGQTSHENSLHIDMRGLNGVLNIDPQKKSVKVLAGTAWRQIQEHLTDFGLAVKVMQTYADFTVGGSISVNCHGRYVGVGPIALSVLQISLLTHDGSQIYASENENPDIFFASIGGYGALGIIVEVELCVVNNAKVERISKTMALEEYPKYFDEKIKNDKCAVFHNADLIPPKFKSMRATTWSETDKPVNLKRKKYDDSLYLVEKYMMWAVTETPFGHIRRKYIYEPLLNMRSKVMMRNQEADYTLKELEPLSRNETTYVLQEYFVPTQFLLQFTDEISEILARFKVQTVNISIRHSSKDPGTYLAWAREEVFALVLYYKQGVEQCDREKVGIWTRQIIDSVNKFDGTYYLPYQPHATLEQFHKSYPRAKEVFALKDKVDPHYRFRNQLWKKYYESNTDLDLFGDRDSINSEFLSVYNNRVLRDKFYLFLQNIYGIYPDLKFHMQIIEVCEKFETDEHIYQALVNSLPDLKTPGSDLFYALPALRKQKKEIQKQTSALLPVNHKINGYLEIGSTGRYVKSLKKVFDFKGPVFLTNDFQPTYSASDLMERGRITKIGKFFDLDNYVPISQIVSDQSLDLVTCYIGLHHCPLDRLAPYLASINRVLRPGGHFILRDHDATTAEMKTFCSLVHTVFNAGFAVSWEENASEFKSFNSIDHWINEVCNAGFSVGESRLLQKNDPSINTMVLFSKL